MSRARVLVLRDKQKEITGRIEAVYRLFAARYESTPDDISYDEEQKLHATVNEEYAQNIRQTFGIDFSAEDIRDRGYKPDYLSGIIAKRVLDKTPPSTNPSWLSPWPEFEDE